MTANPSESPRLTHWLRRLWPLYWFLAALVSFGYANHTPWKTPRELDEGEIYSRLKALTDHTTGAVAAAPRRAL